MNRIAKESLLLYCGNKVKKDAVTGFELLPVTALAKTKSSSVFQAIAKAVE
ncbi:MAG TPA: hypothetical protein VK543_08645 [Puia sp.]|nr:hypothetical protein [Puia sp.]